MINLVSIALSNSPANTPANSPANTPANPVADARSNVVTGGASRSPVGAAPARRRCRGALVVGALVVGALALMSCAERPDIAARIDLAARDAPAPDLVPLGPVLAAAAGLAGAEGTAGAPVAGPPAARIAALGARADRLRGPVVDAGTRARMADAARRAVQIRG